MLTQTFLQAKAACVLIDMCSGVLAPWMTQVIAKVLQIAIICLNCIDCEPVGFVFVTF